MEKSWCAGIWGSQAQSDIHDCRRCCCIFPCAVPLVHEKLKSYKTLLCFVCHDVPWITLFGRLGCAGRKLTSETGCLRLATISYYHKGGNAKQSRIKSIWVYSAFLCMPFVYHQAISGCFVLLTWWARCVDKVYSELWNLNLAELMWKVRRLSRASLKLDFRVYSYSMFEVVSYQDCMILWQ